MTNIKQLISDVTYDVILLCFASYNDEERFYKVRLVLERLVKDALKTEQGEDRK